MISPFFLIWILFFGVNAHAVTCYNPMEDDGAGGCTFVDAHHECNHSTSVVVPASAVAFSVTGANDDARFDSVVNKKLACCMNAFNPTDTYAKFDCIENSKTVYADFNALWASADDELLDGGQMNALLLVGAMGRPITGFYRLDGGRCDNFSEFAAAAAIQPMHVDSAGVATPAGAAYPMPPVTPYLDMKTKLAKSYPATVSDYKNCPILVRAAILVSCPYPSILPNVQRSYTYMSAGVSKTRCPFAGVVQVHLRIEQLFDFQGALKGPTIDTILDRSQSASISLSSIISQKMGAGCEPGTTKKGNACMY